LLLVNSGFHKRNVFLKNYSTIWELKDFLQASPKPEKKKIKKYLFEEAPKEGPARGTNNLSRALRLLGDRKVRPEKEGSLFL
jgi:hypothetical protein